MLSCIALRFCVVIYRELELMLGVALVSDNWLIIFSMRIFSSFIFFLPASSNKRFTALSNCISEW